MEDCPHMYISEFGHKEDMEEEEEDEVHQEEANMDPDPHKHQDPERDGGSFPCQHCERHFSSKQGLDRHLHIHAVADNEAHASKNKSSMSGSHPGQREKTKPLDSVTQPRSSSPSRSNLSSLSDGDHSALQDKPGASDGHHACKYCEKMFNTHTNKRRHERRIHEQNVQVSQEELQRTSSETSRQETEPGDSAEQYMLDVSSDISENLSFYIDGKIVSTSTVSSCEAAEVHSGSSTLVGLDALILDPAHISQVLNPDSVTGKEIPGQPLAKRRTATPPLLPQIQTELESEVVVSSSSSSLVSSLIENLLPQNAESMVAQRERTVFLSPKLKQLLEKQDGLKPTLALIADGQKPCSPVSLSVLPAGTERFKRRTGSPPGSPHHNPAPAEEDGEAVGRGQVESPVQPAVGMKDDPAPPVEEPAVKDVSMEPWSPATGGHSCNQQPLDLSNTVRRHEAVLDLSLQKKSQSESELTLNVVSQALLTEGNNVCTVDDENMSLGPPEAPLRVTDFTILTGADMMTPVEPLVYGLALPSSAPASLASVALQPASPCTIAFASSHSGLPAAPSLITVLAPPHISTPSNQPIQLLAPNSLISPEPLVICTDSALNFSECELTTAFAATNPANPVSLSQSLDPALFLSDQIALNPPLVEATPLSDLPFTPTVTLNDSLINSYNITSNTVLIECTIALEAPGSIVPAVTLLDPPAEPPTPPQMLFDHMEQQQIVSDPTVLMSSISESVTLSSTTSVMPDCPTDPDPEPVSAEPPAVKEEGAADAAVSIPEIPPEAPPEEESSNTPSDAQQQSFAKNFVCNVCDKLFHSMKELGHHAADHADEWPYKCEFCLLLFSKPPALLDHRSSLHGVGKTYVCSACTKEFVYLCNLKQHQEELHPGQQCSYTEEEKGKLRPQNYNSSTKASTESSADESKEPVKKKEEGEVDVAAEELLTTIKIMASDGAKLKGPDVRLGINQHYPSFKPPPFPYHNRSPAGSVASATNFTTHNIPQTFSTAIRCTKCGKSFDNMPELHKHILACANASDKRRYTPKRNPIPLRHFAKSQNGVLSSTNSTNGLNASNRPSQSNRSKHHHEPPVNVKFKMLNKRKKKLVQRVLPQRNKSVSSSNKLSPAQVDQEVFVCPHCSREFTMRRSRTKHMAVCPKKPKEVKKRKEGGISVTKENDGHLHRGAEEKQASPRHKTRLQTSAKRPSSLPVQTVFSSKRSKIIIKESMQPKQETASLNDLPMVRTFNPSMRQYSRVQHCVKGIPLKITIVKPMAPQRDELPAGQSREDAVVSGGAEPKPAV